MLRRRLKTSDPILNAILLIAGLGISLVLLGLLGMGIAYFWLGSVPQLLSIVVGYTAFVFSFSIFISLVMYKIAGTIINLTQ